MSRLRTLAIATVTLLALAGPSAAVADPMPATAQKIGFAIRKLGAMKVHLLREPDAGSPHMQRAVKHLEAAIEELTTEARGLQ